ncbi:hypothetical protein IKR20_02850 [bacterium]|nr:hypothetical protein [bacterium]
MKKLLILVTILISTLFVCAEEEKTDAVTQATEKRETAPAQPAEKAAPEKGKVYEGMPITPEFSKEVIDKITAKYSKMYESYAGVKNTRHVTVEYRDPKTNELLETEKYVYTRKDYWYKDLDYELLSCESNGKPRRKGVIACDPHESKPGIPHFDKNGEKEYIRELVAVEKLNGRLAYKIKMTARKPKGEHFVGHVWVSVDKLEYMQNEGHAGAKRFGEKELYVKYQAKDFNNGQFFHFTSGYTRVLIAPFGYKRILIYKFENKDIELMPKKDKK